MRKRAMTSEVASDKKLTGHINEGHFAALIDGEVIPGRGKTDVVDSKLNTYSVKSAERAQVFMYGRNRFIENTAFQEVGNVANLIISCIDVFPETLADYSTDKVTTKLRLQKSMRVLKDEICKPTIFPQFLSKGLFNGDEVGYLSILPNDLSDGDLPIGQKHFHVFSASDVIHLFSTKLDVQNSKARARGQMDDLKVIFLYRDRGVGGIEILTSRSDKYKRAWCYLYTAKILELLKSNFEATHVEDRQVTLYGSARNSLLYLSSA
jgi:hypothetical protein